MEVNVRMGFMNCKAVDKGAWLALEGDVVHVELSFP